MLLPKLNNELEFGSVHPYKPVLPVLKSNWLQLNFLLQILFKIPVRSLELSTIRKPPFVDSKLLVFTLKLKN